MRSLIISNSDLGGGAARAAYRLHKALCDYKIHSEMLVRYKFSDEYAILSNPKKINKFLNQIRVPLADQINKTQKPADNNMRSGGWLPSNWLKEINDEKHEVVNLHWVGNETLSIKDIGNIKKPLIWTLHDMWPFCGSEHYTNDDDNARWKVGYLRSNKNSNAKGLDIDRFVWLRKKKWWNDKIHIVSPSNWLAKCARDSALFKNHPVSVIPNVLDTIIYKPLDRTFCRTVLNLKANRPVILFGAMGGGKDPRKGYDLLVDALTILSTRTKDLEPLCIIYGQSEPEEYQRLPFETLWLGHIHDDSTLALLYNSSDVMVVPSRQENLPQTATEAVACGCPVVAFNCTGFPDVIIHKETGYLAEPYSAEDMAQGIQWLLELGPRAFNIRNACSLRAQALWSPDVIIPKYMSLYNDAIARYLSK